MPPRPRPRPPCTVCHHQTSKYTCASCRIAYCSVACYKTHKETCSSQSTSTGTSTGVSVPPSAPPLAAPDSTRPPTPEPEPLQDPTPLRPLTSLKWPYVPDVSAYPDPLTRDDPKPLQTHQYEAIATSPTIRALLANSRLQTLLTSIDALRGAERDEALQRALGVDGRRLRNPSDALSGPEGVLDEDTKALRAFTEAVEEAVRGGREDVLGLDWD